jgi:CTP:molybdopterin cytidylyltransferase MocA
MGGPKWRAEIAGRTFLDRIVQALREAGVAKVVGVVGAGFAAEVECRFPDLKLVVNDRPSDGMLSSVRLGLAELLPVGGALIVPVDHPLVRSETYAALVARFGREPDTVIKPAFGGRSGHPILVPQILFATIRGTGGGGSLREVIESSGVSQVRLPCDDAGILANINTPGRRDPVQVGIEDGLAVLTGR